jgi:hypothetical protein
VRLLEIGEELEVPGSAHLSASLQGLITGGSCGYRSSAMAFEPAKQATVAVTAS